MNMNEDLIASVAERAGLPPDKASAAVEAVLGFLKENPDKVSGLLGIEQGASKMGEAKEKLGEAKEKLGDVGERLGDVGEKVGGRIGRLLKRG